MPAEPAATETVTEEDGTNGAEATNAIVVELTCCQVPATDGVSVGTEELAASGAEKCTVMVASLATPEAPSTGVTATTFNGSLEAAGWADGTVVGVADTLPPLERATTVTPIAAITRAMPTPSTMKRCRERLPELDGEREGEWAPVIRGSTQIYQGAEASRLHGRRRFAAPWSIRG